MMILPVMTGGGNMTNAQALGLYFAFMILIALVFAVTAIVHRFKEIEGVSLKRVLTLHLGLPMYLVATMVMFYLINAVALLLGIFYYVTQSIADLILQ